MMIYRFVVTNNNREGEQKDAVTHPDIVMISFHERLSSSG